MEVSRDDPTPLALCVVGILLSLVFSCLLTAPFLMGGPIMFVVAMGLALTGFAVLPVTGLIVYRHNRNASLYLGIISVLLPLVTFAILRLIAPGFLFFH